MLVKIIVGDSELVSFRLTDETHSFEFFVLNQVEHHDTLLNIGQSLNVTESLLLKKLSTQAIIIEAKVSLAIFEKIRVELWDIYLIINKFLMSRNKLSYDTGELYKVVDYGIFDGSEERAVNKLNHIISEINSSLHLLQRLIDISLYANALNHKMVIILSYRDATTF